MDIGKNIATFRKTKNLTQDELGKMLGVTNQAVSKWESGVSMPDIMLLPEIARVLEVSLDEIYGIKPKQKEKQTISADLFPDVAYHELHKLFFDSTIMRFNCANSSDEAQIDYQQKQLMKGERIGCLSNTKGAVVITDSFSFIDRTYKATDSEHVFNSSGTALILKYLSDTNIRKILSYQYKIAFEKSKKDNTVFSLSEVAAACSITEDETAEALGILKQLELNETWTDQNSNETRYQFRMSNAIYALDIFKLAEILTSDSTWLVVRDTSMITDYTFKSIK